jgi:hypothetical protein
MHVIDVLPAHRLGPVPGKGSEQPVLLENLFHRCCRSAARIAFLLPRGFLAICGRPPVGNFLSARHARFERPYAAGLHAKDRLDGLSVVAAAERNLVRGGGPDLIIHAREVAHPIALDPLRIEARGPANGLEAFLDSMRVEGSMTRMRFN